MKPEAEKNVMPSVVARQQRLQMSNAAAAAAAALANQQPRPASSNSRTSGNLEENLTRSSVSTPFLLKSAHELGALPTARQQEFDHNGLVLPKRVAHHPALPTAQPIIRDLNRELKFNQIQGKNVLDQKSELKKALEKLEEGKKKKAVEQERLNRRTSLELRLEERAERIAKEADLQQQQQRQQQQHQNPQTITTQQQPETQRDSSSPAACNPLRNFTIRSAAANR